MRDINKKLLATSDPISRVLLEFHLLELSLVALFERFSDLIGVEESFPDDENFESRIVRFTSLVVAARINRPAAFRYNDVIEKLNESVAKIDALKSRIDEVNGASDVVNSVASEGSNSLTDYFDEMDWASQEIKRQFDAVRHLRQALSEVDEPTLKCVSAWFRKLIRV